jgi:hypothetical protein
MPGVVVPANVPEPAWPFPTEDLVVKDGTFVFFQNFAVGSATPKPAHEAFIKSKMVPYLIAQLNALGFNDTRLTLFLAGFASATGDSFKNSVLSENRARAIGKLIEKHFREQAKSGSASKITQFVFDVKAKGDEVGKKFLGNLGKLLPWDIEKSQSMLRSAIAALKIHHAVLPEDKVVRVRQTFDPKFKVVKVPANEFEETLERFKTRFATTYALLGMAVDQALSQVKSAVKELLQGAEFSQPEILILFKGIEFIVPADVATQFEFIDSRGRIVRYTFLGDGNSVDLGMLEAISHLLSLAKWLSKLPPALQELEDERKAEAALLGFEKKIREAFAKKMGFDPKTLKEVPEEIIEAWARENKVPLTAKQINKLAKMIPLNQTEEAIQKILDAIKKLKAVTGFAKAILDKVAEKGGLVRRVLGDELVDKLLASIKDPGAFFADSTITTDWFNCHFEDVEMPDIGTLGGRAQLEIRSLFASSSTIRIDFSARKNEPLLGFRGHAIIERKWQASTTLGKFEIARGSLRIA